MKLHLIILLIVAVLVNKGLSQNVDIITNSDLILMNADQLVEYSNLHIMHNVDNKAPELKKLAGTFLSDINRLLVQTEAKDVEKINTLTNLVQATEDYLLAIENDLQTCGLRSIVYGKFNEMSDYVDRDFEDVSDMFDDFRNESYLALYVETEPHKLLGVKIAGILANDEELNKEVNEKIIKLAGKCKTVGFHLIKILNSFPKITKY